MQIKDLPVVLLAAGQSKRFHPEFDTHKSLLKIHSEQTIFDVIFEGLRFNGVSDFQVILGYKSEQFKQYLKEHKYISQQKLRFSQVLAEEDYVNGPVYTLRSLLSSVDSEFTKFTVVPSDTIFHPVLLHQFFSMNFNQDQNNCIFFTLQPSEQEISAYNSKIPFCPSYVEKFPTFRTLINEKISNLGTTILIPMIILTHDFLSYVNSAEKLISGKIINNLAMYYQETGRCQHIALKYCLNVPPFLDIDTPLIYNTLYSVKNELFEPYKIK